MVNLELLAINEKHLADLHKQLAEVSYYDYDVIVLEIARVEQRIYNIENGLHGW